MEGEEAAAVEEEEEAVEEEEEVAEEEPQRQQEEMRNSLGQNHPPSTGIAKTSTDSSQISKDICL